MRLVHDRGGWPDAGPIDRSDHRLAEWERRTDALMRLLWSPAKRIIRVDEMRRAIESIEPARYEALGYYERWAIALESLLIEKGVLTKEQIDDRVADRERSGG
ncbi:MAG: nitrile hydratase subunit beta [Chloroflexi bacterium]|nr:nitrile hydratase subunit beta [Chloroflexota bacterium]